jgi:hypothetical protein
MSHLTICQCNACFHLVAKTDSEIIDWGEGVQFVELVERRT